MDMAKWSSEQIVDEKKKTLRRAGSFAATDVALKREEQKERKRGITLPIRKPARRKGLNFVDLAKRRAVLVVWWFHAEHRFLFLRSFKR